MQYLIREYDCCCRKFALLYEHLIDAETIEEAMHDAWTNRKTHSAMLTVKIAATMTIVAKKLDGMPWETPQR